MAYKSTLLSTLIPIRYESTIETLADLQKSELPFWVARSTAMHHAIATDKRPIMKQIYEKSYFYSYKGFKTLLKNHEM